MSRSITQNSSSAVTAGSSVIVPVNTTTGFNAGDYVYTLPTGGVGTRATGTIGVGADVNYVATTYPTTYLSTGDFRTFSYGPYIDQQLYTGTTAAYGAITVATATVSTTTQQHYRNCTLLTGNVVQMYNVDANLYFRIISNTGAIIKAETLLASNYYRFSEAGNFACCCLTSGNIQFVWNDNTASNIKSQQYTSAGTAIGSAGDVTAPASYRNLSMCALSAGGSIVTGINGTSSASTINFVELYADGTFLYNDVVASGLSSGSTYLFPVVGLPASVGQNYWACWVQNTVLNSAGPTGYLSVFSDFSFVANGTTTGTGGQPGSHNFNVTVATDGTICCSRVIYGGTVAIAKFTYAAGSVSFVSSTTLASALSLYLIPTASGAINAIYQSGSTIFMRQISSTNALSTQATLVTVNNDPYYGRFCATGFGSGLVTPMFSASSTTYAAYCIANTIARTSGVTQLTSTASYLPSDGYYLMGVAATDAAANATGQVIVNGTAQLGATYPTITTPIYYSYQTTASQPIFGQRGSVNATTVTLKGLEV